MATLGATNSTTTFPTGSSLEVKEIDGAPDVSNVSIIRVTNGKLTDDGGGQVTLDLSGGGSSPHALLDGTENNDTVAQTPSRGSLIVGNSTPKWDELVIGSASTLLQSDGTDASWNTVNLLSNFHGDTLAASVTRGDIIYGNSTPKWARKAVGTGVLMADGTDVTGWSASPSLTALTLSGLATVRNEYYSGRIVPTNLTGNTDDWNPVDSGTSQSFHDVIQISFDSNGSYNLTGMDVGSTGEWHILTNRGTQTITLKHNVTSSTNNRFWTPNAADYTLLQKMSVYIYYSQPDNRWVVVGPPVSSGSGTNALLDGSVHSDTVAQTVSRGSLIYGNSTPKWDELTIGAANTVLKSDGTDASWQTLSSVGSNVFTATLNLNNTQTLALGTSPQTIISAQGAGTVVLPIIAEVVKDSVAGAYTGTFNFRFRYTGDTSDLLAAGTFNAGTNIQTGNFVQNGVTLIKTITTFDVRNKAVQVSNSGDMTGGNAANTTKVRVWYTIADFN